MPAEKDFSNKFSHLMINLQSKNNNYKLAALNKILTNANVNINKMLAGVFNVETRALIMIILVFHLKLIILKIYLIQQRIIK